MQFTMAVRVVLLTHKYTSPDDADFGADCFLLHSLFSIGQVVVLEVLSKYTLDIPVCCSSAA